MKLVVAFLIGATAALILSAIIVGVYEAVCYWKQTDADIIRKINERRY